jgi:hypothetical protein
LGGDGLHRAGKLNVAADALSRRSDYLEMNSLEWIPIQNELLTDVQDAVRDDKDYQVLVAAVVAKKRWDYTLLGGLLYKDTKLVIPTKAIQEELLQLAHDGPLGGHLGRDKTLERLQRCYYWTRHMTSKSIAGPAQTVKLINRPTRDHLGCCTHFPYRADLGKV